MTSTNRLKHHAALIDRMANTLGIDLEEEVLRGSMPADELPDAVLRCSGCTNPADCDSWLTRNEKGEQAAQATPGYCRNADLFRDLRKTVTARG